MVMADPVLYHLLVRRQATEAHWRVRMEAGPLLTDFLDRSYVPSNANVDRTVGSSGSR